jgi:hypothetical protein
VEKQDKKKQADILQAGYSEPDICKISANIRPPQKSAKEFLEKWLSTTLD